MPDRGSKKLLEDGSNPERDSNSYKSRDEAAHHVVIPKDLRRGLSRGPSHSLVTLEAADILFGTMSFGHSLKWSPTNPFNCRSSRACTWTRE